MWKAERGKGRGRELFLIRWRERERKKLLTLPPPPSYTYLPSLPRWMGMGCNLLMEENSGAVAEAPYYMNAGIARPRHDRITQPSWGIGVDCYMATPAWMDGGRMMADTAALPSSLGRFARIKILPGIYVQFLACTAAARRGVPCQPTSSGVRMRL